jgi:hypothetical protein
MQNFDDQKLKKLQLKQKLDTIFYQKLHFAVIYLFLGLHEDVQTTEEAFSPQKRTSSTSEHEILFFSFFCGSYLPSWFWIPNPDMDPLT